MAVFFNGRAIFGILAIAALAGCEGTDLGGMFSGNGGGSGASGQSAPATGPRPEGSVRVVEAPEVFDVAETALWDGRPSLGLIWVAYEGADPTNVIIRNEENGQFVVGALYRRERFFPGPPFQLSSDAAAELGILAGKPTQIRVIALKEEVVEAPPPIAEPAAPAEDMAQDVADISIEEDTLPAPQAAEVSAQIDPIAAAAAAIEAADPVIPVAPVIDPANARRPTTEGPNAPLPRRVAVAAPEPVEPVAIDVASPISAPSAAVSNLARPFIQVGIFSVQANANKTQLMLSDAGVIPFVEEQRVGGRVFYRVVVGPAANSSERDELLSVVKAQGFGDAYFVKN